MDVTPAHRIPDTRNRPLLLLFGSNVCGWVAAWAGGCWASPSVQDEASMVGPLWFWATTVLHVALTSAVALSAVSNRWKVAGLALGFLQIPLLAAALAVFGKSLPVFPLLSAVCVGGFLPLCLRHFFMDSEGREASGAHSQNYETSQPAENDVSEGVPAFAETLAETLAEPIGVVSVIEMSAEAGLDASFPDAMVDAENAVNRGSLGESTIHERVLSGTECAEPTVLAETSAEMRDVVPAGPVEAAPLPEPRREECTVMHCELSNHAVLVQSLPPAAFTALINQVLVVFESMVTAREGICDRLGSEGMRAFFRSQAGDSNHAETALQCALALRARLENVSQKCEMQCGYELDLRLGINSGEVVVAPFGSSAKSVLSVAGEPAEWAVRLAGANLLYGSKILLGARTSVFALGSVETRPIDLLQRQLPPEPPEEVFELLALRGSLAADALERLVRYREGVEHFRARRWREAAAALRAARPPRQEDDAIDLLLHRISEQEALADYVVEGH